METTTVKKPSERLEEAYREKGYDGIFKSKSLDPDKEAKINRERSTLGASVIDVEGFYLMEAHFNKADSKILHDILMDYWQMISAPDGIKVAALLVKPHIDSFLEKLNALIS